MPQNGNAHTAVADGEREKGAQVNGEVLVYDLRQDHGFMACEEIQDCRAVVMRKPGGSSWTVVPLWRLSEEAIAVIKAQAGILTV